jgi:hypothetical protein
MASLQEEAKNIAIHPSSEAHETMMKTEIIPHLAPHSKQLVGIWDIAIRRDAQERSS